MAASVLTLLLVCLSLATAIELTFEMEPNDRNCFSEDVDGTGHNLTLEYQVVYGGQLGKLDVDVTITGPGDAVLYKENRKTFDDVVLTVTQPGTYEVCFSNEFSTFSHKTIYFDFFLGDGFDALQEVTGKEDTALTKMADITIRIHTSLFLIFDSQTHHRVNEIQGRNLAEDLNTRVKVWSFFQSVLMVSLSVLQVYMVRHLFLK